MLLLPCRPLMSQLISPIIHLLLSLSHPSPPVPSVALVRGSRPFTGEGTNESHSSAHVLYRLTCCLVMCDENINVGVAPVVLPLFPHVCLLNCCCIVFHPCRLLHWKMLLSFHPLECARNTVANRWLRHTGVFYCSGNNKQPHRKREEGSLALQAQRTVLARDWEQGFVVVCCFVFFVFFFFFVLFLV